MSEEKTMNMPIYAPEDIKKGIYSNFFGVSYDAKNPDFYLDFYVMTPHPVPSGALVARVFLTPSKAKELHSQLGDMLQDYDNKLAEIKPENNGKENT